MLYDCTEWECSPRVVRLAERAIAAHEAHAGGLVELATALDAAQAAAVPLLVGQQREQVAVEDLLLAPAAARELVAAAAASSNSSSNSRSSG